MIWKTIGRILVVSIAFLFAGLTSMIMLVVTGGRELAKNFSGSFEADPLFSLVSDIWGMILFAASLGPALTIVPALVAITIGEVIRIRSVIYYMIAGGIAMFAIPLLYVTGDGTPSATINARYTIIFLAAGFAGGFVYWAIAGRKA